MKEKRRREKPLASANPSTERGRVAVGIRQISPGCPLSRAKRRSVEFSSTSIRVGSELRKRR